MARYTITVSDSKAAAILKYLKEQEGVKVEAQYEINEEPIVVHDWHKDIIDERLKSVQDHPERLIDWETLERNIKRKYGF
jgi:hypothetical protein